MNTGWKIGIVAVAGLGALTVALACSRSRRPRGFGDLPVEPKRAPIKAGRLVCPYCSGAIACEPERGVCSPHEIYLQLLPKIRRAKQESFWVAFLDARNRWIGVKEVHRGTVGMVVAHPRDVFREAMAKNASAVILVHNHPSGSAVANTEDTTLTIRMVQAGKIVGIPVLDHLVVGREGNYSALRTDQPGLFG